MDDYDHSTLGETKAKYMARLESRLFRPLYIGLYSIYEEAKKEANEQRRPEMALSLFQDKLAETRLWNQDRIDLEYNRVLELSKCDWLDELVTAVFISQCKVYTAVRVSQSTKKFTLTLPKTSHYIHQVYVECARRLWPYVNLFDDTLPDVKRQKNLQKIEGYIREGIDETVASMLPIREIVHEYTKLADGDVDASLDASGNAMAGGAVDASGEPIVKEATNSDTDMELSATDMALLTGVDASGGETDASGADVAPASIDATVSTNNADATTTATTSAPGDVIAVDSSASATPASDVKAVTIPLSDDMSKDADSDVPVLQVDDDDRPDGAAPVARPVTPVALTTTTTASAEDARVRFSDYNEVFSSSKQPERTPAPTVEDDDEEIEAEPLNENDYINLDAPSVVVPQSPRLRALSESEYKSLD